MPIRSDKRHVLDIITAHIFSGHIHPQTAFTVLPRHDGLGSQLLSRLSIAAVAKDLACVYYHAPFENVAHAEGDAGDWTDRCELELGIGQGFLNRDQCTFPVINFMDFAFNRNLWHTPHLVEVPHMYAYCDRSPEVYASVVQPVRLADRAPGQPLKVAIHVRRGDVSQSEVADRFTTDQAICRQVQFLSEAACAEGLPLDLVVYSNGSKEELRPLKKLGCRLELELGAIETYRDLCSADILLAAKSTLSFAAALHNPSMILYQPFRRKSLPHWHSVSKSGAFDKAAVQRDLSRLFLTDGNNQNVVRQGALVQVKGRDGTLSSRVSAHPQNSSFKIIPRS